MTSIEKIPAGNVISYQGKSIRKGPTLRVIWPQDRYELKFPILIPFGDIVYISTHVDEDNDPEDKYNGQLVVKLAVRGVVGEPLPQYVLDEYPELNDIQS